MAPVRLIPMPSVARPALCFIGFMVFAYALRCASLPALKRVRLFVQAALA